jgi:hypothetical protein
MRSARDAGLAAKALHIPARTAGSSNTTSAAATGALDATAAASATSGTGSGTNSGQHNVDDTDVDDEFNRQQPTPMSGRLNYQTRRGFMREVSVLYNICIHNHCYCSLTQCSVIHSRQFSMLYVSLVLLEGIIVVLSHETAAIVLL